MAGQRGSGFASGARSARIQREISSTISGTVSRGASTRINEPNESAPCWGGHILKYQEVRRSLGSRRSCQSGTKLVVRIPGSRSRSIPTSLPTNSGRATLFMRPMARRFDSLMSLSCPSTAIQASLSLRVLSSSSHSRSIPPSSRSRRLRTLPRALERHAGEPAVAAVDDGGGDGSDDDGGHLYAAYLARALHAIKEVAQPRGAVRVAEVARSGRPLEVVRATRGWVLFFLCGLTGELLSLEVPSPSPCGY